MSKLRVVKLILSLLLLFIILGSFSLWPFTKLLKPYILAKQWVKVNFNDKIDFSCTQYFINKNIPFTNVNTPEAHILKGCFINTPMLFSHLSIKLSNISFPAEVDPVVLNCNFAKQLHIFITEIFIPAVRDFYKQEPMALLHKGVYFCRNQASTTSLKSEHAFAEAIDFAGVELADGRRVLVENNYYDNNLDSEFLRTLEKLACKHFGTNLGPKYDESHHDHLHWSIGFPRVCST